MHRASQHVPIWWPTSRESLAKISWLMVEVAKPKKLKIHQSLSVESGDDLYIKGDHPTLVKVCEGQDDVVVVVVVVVAVAVVAVFFCDKSPTKKEVKVVIVKNPNCVPPQKN